MPHEQYWKNFYAILVFVLIILASMFLVMTIRNGGVPNKPAFPVNENVAATDEAQLRSHAFPPATTTPEGKPYQYVVFAFDGSRSLKEWRETLDFAKQMTASGTPLHFTYFINAIYLVPEEHKNIYHPPHYSIGTSLVGYGSSTEEIGARVKLINEAYLSGHEIGSHGVGHIPGFGWSKADWESELSQFAALLERSRGGIDTTIPLLVPKSAIRGFRAPDLVRNHGLEVALDRLGYSYDASGVSREETWPTKIGGHWELPLASIPFRGKRILSMDYNFYLANSRAHNVLKRGMPAWQKDYDEMLAAYLNYFNKNYSSNRAPVFIGHHFSEWNDGLYGEVMKEMAREVCGKPYVRCATHQETIEYLNALGKN